MTVIGSTALALGIILSLCAAPALAQSPSDKPTERPRTAEQALQDGELALRMGRTGAAERLFEESLALEPNYWPAYAVVGDFYAESQRDCPRALIFYETYLDHSPRRGATRRDVLNRTLRCRIQLQDWSRAIKEANALRQFHLDRSDHAAARAALRQRAELELRAGRAEEAFVTAQRVLFDDYQDVAAHLLRARIRIALGRYKEALENYLYIQNTFDRVGFLDLNIGVALIMLERHGEALVALRRSLHLDGEVAETWRWMAHAHQELHDRVSAERAYRRCLALTYNNRSPTAISSHNNLAWLLITQSKPGDPRLLEALQLARLAVASSDGREAAYIDTVAEALLRLGRPAEALIWGRRALMMDPDNLYFHRQVRRFERYGAGFESSGGRVRLDRWTSD